MKVDSNLIAKRAYLSLLLSPPVLFLPPATIRPYDRPDAAQIIQSLAARTMGHRSSMSSAINSGSVSHLPTTDSSGALHNRTLSTSAPGLNGFVMPKSQVPVQNGRTSNGQAPRISVHHRSGSASSTWGRQAGGGVLNFTMPSSSSAQRLPTHSAFTIVFHKRVWRSYCHHGQSYSYLETSDFTGTHLNSEGTRTEG